MKQNNLYYGYIYLITNNITNKYYVGQTSRTVDVRWKEHNQNAYGNNKFGNDTYLYRSMRLYGVESFSINVLKEIHSSSEEDLKSELNRLEIEYIEYYKSLVPNGYNMTKGGDNKLETFKITVDQYSKDGVFIKSFSSISEALESLGKSTNHGDCIHDCCIGIRNLAYGYVWRYKGNPFNEFEYINKSIKSVDVYYMNRKFIGTYNSISDALRDLGLSLTNTGNVSYCCKGKIKQACGYIWRYHGDSFDKYEISKRVTNQKVIQYKTNGDKVDIYNSLNDASSFIEDTLNINNAYAAISACINHKNKTAFGYVWRWENDEFSFEKWKSSERRPMNCYDLDDNFLEYYEDTTVLDQKFYKPGINTPKNVIVNIRANCSKRTKSAYGFHWYYADDPNQPDKTRIINSRTA